MAILVTGKTSKRGCIFFDQATGRYYDEDGNDYYYSYVFGEYVLGSPPSGTPLPAISPVEYFGVGAEPLQKVSSQSDWDSQVKGKFVNNPPACQCGVMKTHGKMAEGLVDIHSDWCDLYKYLKAQERIALDTAPKNK